MTKNEAMRLLDISTDTALARELCLTRQAVHKWPADEHIADKYHWMLYGLYPQFIPKPELSERQKEIMESITKRR